MSIDECEMPALITAADFARMLKVSVRTLWRLRSGRYYVEALAENVALATYSAKTALVVSHRSSLWVFRDNRWQLLFHQGTIAA